jgi:hypothetical protein
MLSGGVAEFFSAGDTVGLELLLDGMTLSVPVEAQLRRCEATSEGMSLVGLQFVAMSASEGADSLALIADRVDACRVVPTRQPISEDCLKGPPGRAQKAAGAAAERHPPVVLSVSF